MAKQSRLSRVAEWLRRDALIATIGRSGVRFRVEGAYFWRAFYPNPSEPGGERFRTLNPNPITSLSSLLLSSLELSDTKVYAPQIRARLGTAARPLTPNPHPPPLTPNPQTLNAKTPNSKPGKCRALRPGIAPRSRALRVRPNLGLGIRPFTLWQRRIRLCQPGNARSEIVDLVQP